MRKPESLFIATSFIMSFIISIIIFLAALPPQRGGIAQLVERQLCKLDVWGSNPHASTNLLVGWDENTGSTAMLRSGAITSHKVMQQSLCGCEG